MEVLSFVVGILVVSIVWLLSSRGKQGTDGQAEVLPKRDVRENDVTIRELNGSNFPNWEYTLRLALRRLRAEAALDRQYSVNSQANQVALNKIAGSVDDRHLTMIRGMDSACDAFETISREYTLNDAVKQALIERDIRDVSLEGFEEKQVNEYINKIDKLVDDLKMAGALLTSERELCLYVDQLPKELVPYRANSQSINLPATGNYKQGENEGGPDPILWNDSRRRGQGWQGVWTGYHR